MKRAIAGLMSLALMTGGILAAPTALAAERAGTCNVDAGAPAQRRRYDDRRQEHL